MSDDTPTQRFDAPLTPSTPPDPVAQQKEEQQERRRGVMFALIALSAALLVVLIVVLIVLLGRDGSPTAAITPSDSATATTSASATPSADANSTPSAAAPAPTTAPKPSSAPSANGAPVFTSFNIPDATCTGSTGTSAVTIQYSSVGATSAYFGISVANAKEAPTDGPLPPNGPYTYDYQCSNPTQIWVITLVDGAGGTTNKSREVHSGAK